MVVVETAREGPGDGRGMALTALNISKIRLS
jgi:hypothetical protein